MPATRFTVSPPDRSRRVPRHTPNGYEPMQLSYSLQVKENLDPGVIAVDQDVEPLGDHIIESDSGRDEWFEVHLALLHQGDHEAVVVRIRDRAVLVDLFEQNFCIGPSAFARVMSPKLGSSSDREVAVSVVVAGVCENGTT